MKIIKTTNFNSINGLDIKAYYKRDEDKLQLVYCNGFINKVILYKEN